jgi:phosphoribosylaminoimidazole carboxylase PurE protein
MRKCAVMVVAGSRSDLQVMIETQKTLEWFGVTNEVVVASAHRQPDRVRQLASKARERGVQVIVAGAGMAAHLAGAMASHTTLPVIGVPLATEPFGALDSLLSTVQMPRGIPVGVVAAGSAGAVNAALLAVEILSIRDASLARKLEQYRKGLRGNRAK